MKRRFVIAIDDATSDQQNTVTEFLKDKANVGYWHWFSDVWLVSDPYQKWTAKELRDELSSLIPASHKLVVQIDGDNTWSGFGNTKMFEWLQDTWTKE